MFEILVWFGFVYFEGDKDMLFAYIMTFVGFAIFLFVFIKIYDYNKLHFKNVIIMFMANIILLGCFWLGQMASVNSSQFEALRYLMSKQGNLNIDDVREIFKNMSRKEKVEMTIKANELYIQEVKAKEQEIVKKKDEVLNFKENDSLKGKQN